MKILIIEDDAAVRQELKQLLENALYQTAVLAAFENITQDILEMQPDLVLLDVNLPGQSGFDVCQSVRGKSDVPIIFVTGRTDSMDELNGMLKGGDDYIAKPFHAPVLLARIAAVLKRTQRADPGVKREIHRGVELDTARACVMYQGKCAELSKNELKILHCLFQHKDEIVPRIDLVEYLWDQQAFIDDNALSVNVARLRAKLEQIGIHHFIQTKRGMGYRI
ncbi:MAG: response regulator transcription factor [Eubacterium sp.]|mgnify:CR=1 FL=1|nr:response regulator transcription factor [Eubacterium sp.]